MAKITTFTPDTARQIATFVRDALRKSSPTLSRFDRVTPRTREVRWAITATNYSFPTYPTTGNVVMVQFGDYEPDTSTQNIEPTKTIAWNWTEYGTEEEDYAAAIVTVGVIPPEGTYVKAWRDGSQWYIEGLTRLKGKTNASISAGSSGTCGYYWTTSEIGTLTGYWDWMDGGGGSISSGKEIMLEWYAPGSKWLITAAEVDARKQLGMDTGDRFLVFGHFEGQGLIFIRVEAAEELLNVMSSRLDEVMKLIKQSRTADVRKRGDGKRS